MRNNGAGKKKLGGQMVGLFSHYVPSSALFHPLLDVPPVVHLDPAGVRAALPWIRGGDRADRAIAVDIRVEQ
jgi:hypothetical protein